MAEPDTARSINSVRCPKLNNRRNSAAECSHSKFQIPNSKFLMASLLHLSERFVDEPLVVLFRQVSLDDLRGNHDREVDGLGPNLLERARRFQPDLTLRVLHHGFGFGARLLLQLFTQPLGVLAAAGDDALRLDPRLAED